MAHNDRNPIRSFPGNKEMLPTQTQFPSQQLPQVMYGTSLPHPMCNIVPSGYPMVQNRFYAQPNRYQTPLLGTFRPVVPIAGQLGITRGPIANIHPTSTQEHRKSSCTTPGSGNYLDEQKKIEKERNFQVQQQRLKQFNVSGRKCNLSPGYLENLFGTKIERKQSSSSDQTTATKFEPETSSRIFPQKFLPKEEQVIMSKPTESDKESCLTMENKDEASKQTNKDPKALDNMMNECFDLSRPHKAKTFHKPSVKDVQPVSQQTMNFSSSEKACNWRDIEIDKLQDIFTLPKPRFPSWCEKKYVPPLYHQVEEECTAHGTQPIDTAQLYPILTSSGLQRELLGQIWEVCNQITPGQLTQQELYAILALIALAQMGHPTTCIEDLHSLPHPVVPVLQYFMFPSSVSRIVDSSKTQHLAEQGNIGYTSSSPVPVEISHTQIKSSIISEEIPQPEIPNLSMSEGKDQTTMLKSENAREGSFESETLDFGDFKSATFPSMTQIEYTESTVEQNKDSTADDFDEFQQAPIISNISEYSNSRKTLIKQQHPMNDLFNPTSNKKFESDLMSPEEEDKYSVFRSLEKTLPPKSSNWGFSEILSSDISDKHLPPDMKHLPSSENKSLEILNSEATLTEKNTKELVEMDDEFGDFLTADITVSPAKDDFSGFESFQTSKIEEFCDFASFQTELAPAVTVTDSFDEFSMISANSHLTGQPRMDNGLEVTLNSQSKDSVSLAESQSVSSLELGTFDSVVSGCRESQSSLSRHGSIPSLDFKVSLTRQGSAHSLDLKGSTLDHADEEFGEMKSYSIPRKISSHSPSPSFDLSKGSEEDLPAQPPKSSRALFQQSTTPFTITDRYSFIRTNGKEVQEDCHVSEWLKCLRSCHNLVHNANDIFNQMNSSIVCNEVIGTEEGSNYIKNLVEVYRVVKRIETSIKATGKQTDQLQELLKDINQSWNSLSVFMAHSSLISDESSMDFSTGILHCKSENLQKACGVCLLNVDARSKAFDREEDCYKLTYGGRQYHASCANFWVNCVDPLLPALQLPQLL